MRALSFEFCICCFVVRRQHPQLSIVEAKDHYSYVEYELEVVVRSLMERVVKPEINSFNDNVQALLRNFVNIELLLNTAEKYRNRQQIARFFLVDSDQAAQKKHI